MKIDIENFELPIYSWDTLNEIINETKKRKERELYLIAEGAKAKGMTFDRFLAVWAKKISLEINKTNKK